VRIENSGSRTPALRRAHLELSGEGVDANEDEDEDEGADEAARMEAMEALPAVLVAMAGSGVPTGTSLI
jgi:hypothetical protein